MKQRKTVRVAGPFSVEAQIETYPDKSSEVLGYNIRGLARIRTGCTPRRSLRLNWKIFRQGWVAKKGPPEAGRLRHAAIRQVRGGHYGAVDAN